MEEEEDTCRICHCGSEPGAPLYYPCKCHGSIRHVHQDCLIEWLTHSRKKYCELCQHPFTFHKRYKADMPAGTLPFKFYLRRLARRSFSTVVFGLRAVLVAFMWLAVLPLINIYVWRFQFSAADIIAAGLGASFPEQDASLRTNVSRGLTGFLWSSTKRQAASTGWGLGIFPSTGAVMAPPPARSGDAAATFTGIAQDLLHDCFEGQILTCVIVVIVVGIFLLRDWIHQNVPQRVNAAPQPAAAAPAVPVVRVEAPAAPQAAVPVAIGAIEAGLPDRPDPLLVDFDPVNVDPTARIEFSTSGQRVDENEWSDIEEDQPEIVPEREQSSQGQGALTGEVDRSALQALRLQHFDALLSGNTAGGTTSHEATSDGDAPVTARSAVSIRRGRESDANSTSAQAAEDFQADDLQALAVSSRVAKGKMRAYDDELSDQQAQPSHPHESEAVEESNTASAITTTGSSESSQRASSPQTAAETPTTAPGGFGTPDLSLSGPNESQRQDHNSSSRAEDGNLPAALLSAAEEDIDADEEAWADTTSEIAAEDVAVGGNDPPAIPMAGDAQGANAAPVARHPGVRIVLEDMEEVEEAFDNAWDDIDPADAAVVDEIDEEALGEDLDGLLDAIGMVGSLTILFQNVALVSVLCSFLLMFFAAVPYVWGKTMSVLDFVSVLALPIHLLRFVTDPLFDYLFAASFKIFAHCANTAKDMLPVRFESILSSCGSFVSSCSDFVSDLVRTVLRSKDSVMAGSVAVSSTVAAPYSDMLPSALRSPPSFSHLASSLTSTVISAGKSVYDHVEATRNGGSLSNRLTCIFLGHMYWLGSLAAQATLSKYLPIPHLKWARTWMTEQTVMLRVLFFLVFELVTFPIMCGILLDFCLSPLVSRVSTINRLSEMALSTAFIHWVVGTVYMFLVAQFVSLVRKILRPGVLCFIRDPSDSDYQPIKEILDRSIAHHLRKIGISVLMYIAVGLGAFGCNVHLVRLLAPSVMPLRWKPHDPASSIPYDLILSHIVLPLIVNKARPNVLFRNGVRQWTILAARLLRLSDFLLGHKRAEERYVYETTWGHWWRRISGRMTAADLIEPRSHDTGFARVLADNNVPLIPPVFVRTDAEGRPIDPADLAALDRQARIVSKMTTKPRYTIVYAPPNFQRRVIAFLLLAWLSISIALAAIVFVPIALGRWAISWISARQHHDFYPFVIGCAILWVSIRTIKSVIRDLRGRPSSSRRRSRPKSRSQVLSHLRRRSKRVVKRGLSTLHRLVKIAYLCATLLGVMPAVYGVVLYRYIIVPLRYSSSEIPEIPLAYCWAIGCLFINISLVARRHSRIYKHLRSLPSNLRRPPILKITRQYLIPELLQWLAAFAGPQIVVVLAFKLFPSIRRSVPTDQMWLRGAYDFTLGYLCTYDLTVLLIRKMNGWTGVLRDELFLESTELRNYQPPDGEDQPDLPPASIALPPSPPLAPHLEADGPVPDVLVERR